MSKRLPEKLSGSLYYSVYQRTVLQHRKRGVIQFGIDRRLGKLHRSRTAHTIGIVIQLTAGFVADDALIGIRRDPILAEEAAVGGVDIAENPLPSPAA